MIQNMPYLPLRDSELTIWLDFGHFLTPLAPIWENLEGESTYKKNEILKPEQIPGSKLTAD